MARSPDYNFVDFLMKKIPGDLWDAFRAKCAAHVPPLSMKYAILTLVAQFCDYKPSAPAIPPGKHKPTRTGSFESP